MDARISPWRFGRFNNTVRWIEENILKCASCPVPGDEQDKEVFDSEYYCMREASAGHRSADQSQS
jgi:hypothetical protein